MRCEAHDNNRAQPLAGAIISAKSTLSGQQEILEDELGISRKV
jgi:hypothetical protein